MGSHTFFTASQISTANSVGVSEKHSGENSKVHSVSCIDGSSFVKDLINFVVSMDLAMASSLDMLNTTSRKTSLVAK